MRESTLSGRRVLFVEDEYFLADALDAALREAGATVLGPVPSVEAALRPAARGSKFTAQRYIRAWLTLERRPQFGHSGRLHGQH